MKTNETITGLNLLRVPFEKHHVSKLPKPTKKQTDDVKADYKNGIRCQLCGGWHHKDVVHLDYVGHAALTDRLLDADPNWNWEPMSINQDGSPKFDQNNGLWIKLTVCGVTRIGYGHPDGKSGGDSFKETIGDALRNAAMRFGAALDLWHKGDLHVDQTESTETLEPKKNNQINQSKPVTNGNDITLKAGKQKGVTISTITDQNLVNYFNWMQTENAKKPLTGPLSDDFKSVSDEINKRNLVPF